MEKYKLYDLGWDSNYFGIKCGKLILEEDIFDTEWDIINNVLKKFELVFIENKNGSSLNEKKIVQNTNAYLSDINIQFVRSNMINNGISENVKILERLPFSEEILTLAEFPFSRFVEDERLRSLGGDKVYQQWLINSFSKTGKFFALYEIDGIVTGFILFSFKEKECLIELIVVSSKRRGVGIGKTLFDSVVSFAFDYGKNNIKVGTQLKNKSAINFYHSVGCMQVSFSTIYHLWND